MQSIHPLRFLTSQSKMSVRIKSALSSHFLRSKNRLWVDSRKYTDGKDAETTSKKPISDLTPMDQPVPGLPTPVYATLKDDHHSTQITKLSNGLTVASESRFGEYCTVGVVIDSGSRYEVAYPSGISHFLEKLAFSSTKKFPNKDEMLAKLEKHGGICDSQASRDTFIYAASAYSAGLDDIMNLLGEVVLRPLITDEELEIARQTIGFELESLKMRPEQETLLVDMVHAAAYRDNTLGLPKLCPEQNVDKISRDVLFTYLNHHYVPNRMVVAGVGVDHERLVEATQKYFVDHSPIWQNREIATGIKNIGIDKSIAQYTGGIITEECDIPQFASAGLPVLSHVMIGLEGCSHQHKDFITTCVLNMMMGGGGSFSAGGPGKGMYSRLYTNVLNRYHWMYSATAYNHAYADTGLFCIHASAPPTHVREMVQVIVREFVAMAGNVSDQELRRAKTQLQSMLLMNLESRPVVFEDIARQVLATGCRKRPQYFIDEIEKITKDDIIEVSRKLLSSQPCIAARGDLHKFPTLDNIQASLLDNHKLRKSKLSLFR